MPRDTWGGIGLHPSGCIKDLRLKGLSGVFSDVNLPNLENLLIISNPLLIGSIPDFTQLNKLEKLDLSANPVSSTLNISLEKLDKFEDDWQISIVNMQGQGIQTMSGVKSNEKIELSISHLSPGVYLCYISSSEFRTWKKWIKIP